jgi:O-antigen/teichoic acid export membrane protein
VSNVQLEPELEPRDSAARAVSVAEGSLLIFVSSLVRSAGFFVAALILARGLGPSGRGTIAFITVTALVVARLGKLGLGQATGVLSAQRPAQRATLLSNLVAFSLAVSLTAAAIVGGGLYVAGARPAGLTSVDVLILAAAVVAAGLVDDNFLIGCGRLRDAAAISAVGGWLYPTALAIAALAEGLSVESAGIAWIAAHLAWATILAGGGIRAFGFALPSRSQLADALRFGLRAWGGGVSQLLNARLDQILLGAIASEFALGLYAVAVNAAEVLLFVPAAIATSLLPAVARERESGPGRTLRTFRSAFVLTSATIGVAAALGWVLIPLVFGSRFSDSTEPFLWLLPGALGYTALGIFSNSLLASDAPGLSSLSIGTALGTGLALDLALIPPFGAAGAAAAASAAFLAGGATAAALYRRMSGYAWLDIVPRPADVAFLGAVARRIVRRSPGPRSTDRPSARATGSE